MEVKKANGSQLAGFSEEFHTITNQYHEIIERMSAGELGILLDLRQETAVRMEEAAPMEESVHLHVYLHWPDALICYGLRNPYQSSAEDNDW